jgi:serine/threonine protein kinase
MTPCGTVGYTAPEIVRDERYSKSVDMWALGCVLYTLLCGFPPFYDESIQVLSEKVAKGQYSFLSPWWDDISQSSKDLVSHLLEVDPEKRYTINEFFEHPWVKAGYSTPPAADVGSSGDTQAAEASGGDSSTNVIPREDVPPPLSPLLPTPYDVPDFPAALARNLQTPPVFSPGAATLKEVFDVSYAVHRMEEESAHRRRLKMGGDTKNLRQLQMSGHLNAMDDIDSEGDTSDGSMSQQQRQSAHASIDSRAADAVPMRTGASHFDLNLEGSTLLGRRRKTLESVQV